MTKQSRSPGGGARGNAGRPDPEADRSAAAGQASAERKVGLTSDEQPDLVAPGGVNERDHGAADDKPMGGGSVNLDDDSELRPRGNTARTGGTWDAQGGDSGELGKPTGPGLSERNGPSDPDAKKSPRRPRS